MNSYATGTETADGSFSSSTPRLDRFRWFIAAWTVVSFFTYPLLALLAIGINAVTGLTPTTPSAGFMEHDPLSDVGMYMFMYGMPASVAMTFIYIALRGWSNPLKKSKLQVAGWMLMGTIATCISFTVFTIVLVLMSALIHGSFN